MSMVEWDTIACQRGCERHMRRLRVVHLDGPTPYHDLTDIPARLGRVFRMWVWDPDAHPVDGGPYCPAHDAVSETIWRLGVWEPAETVLALQVLSTAEPGQVMVDYGCQVGWYSLLGASYGLQVLAVDADADCLDLLRMSARENGWGDRIDTVRHRFGHDELTPPRAVPDRIRLVKIDLEGAEDAAVATLWPSIAEGRVDHLMIEVSPCWGDYYPTLVADLAAVGMVPYVVPDKAQPPVDLTGDITAAMADHSLVHLNRAALKALVAGWTQRDMWFRREGASW